VGQKSDPGGDTKLLGDNQVRFKLAHNDRSRTLE